MDMVEVNRALGDRDSAASKDGERTTETALVLIASALGGRLL